MSTKPERQEAADEVTATFGLMRDAMFEAFDEDTHHDRLLAAILTVAAMLRLNRKR